MVTATVKDTAPYGKDPQYLLSFVVNGQTEAYWSTDVRRGLTAGDRVSVIVNRGDHADFEPTAAYGRRWGLYLIQLRGSAAFAFLDVMVSRMDAAEFRRYSRARCGLATDYPVPTAPTVRSAGRPESPARRSRASRARKSK